jgi:MFS-type transporter involved in bile tolerance (Atg22 family)
LAIRFASTSERKAEIEMKSPLANLNWSVLSLPFLWPLFKSARKKYESSAETLKDGVKRLKKIDVDRYAKPIRKRWKSWTR